MALVDVINQKGEKVNSIELDDSVFNAEVRDTLVQNVVVWQLAKRRSGTASTKTRSRIRRRKETLAAEGDGTSACGNQPFAYMDRGWNDLWS